MSKRRYASALETLAKTKHMQTTVSTLSTEGTAVTISLHEMKARWVCTEIRSERTSRFYQDPQMPVLQARLRNLVFADVATQDRDTLAEMWEEARGRYLYMYLEDVTGFVLKYWPATQLGKVSAMSQMDPAGKGRFFPILEYAKSPRPAGPDAEHDPRVVADNSVLSGKDFRAGDPVTVGLYSGRQVLIDGYGRGVRFMQCADASDRVPVFVPIPASPRN
jgi:hypothetical protein